MADERGMHETRIEHLAEIRESMQDRLTALRRAINADDAEIAALTARRSANEETRRALELGIKALTDAAKYLEIVAI